MKKKKLKQFIRDYVRGNGPMPAIRSLRSNKLMLAFIIFNLMDFCLRIWKLDCWIYVFLVHVSNRIASSGHWFMRTPKRFHCPAIAMIYLAAPFFLILLVHRYQCIHYMKMRVKIYCVSIAFQFIFLYQKENYSLFRIEMS